MLAYPGKEDGGERKSAHQERKPYRGNPGHGNEEQDIGIVERKRPPYGGPKGGVVDHIPDGKGPKENCGACPGPCTGKQGNAEEHEDGDGLAKDFEG